MSPTPRIVLDRQTCSGFFSCVKVSDHFARGEDDKSDLVDGTEERADVWAKDVPDEDLEAAREAAHVCPVDAIQVLDDEGNLVAGPKTLPIDQ